MKDNQNKSEMNYKNRIAILEMEIQEMIENKDLAIERALNKAKNQIKSKGEQSKEALEEIARLKRENELKDQ